MKLNKDEYRKGVLLLLAEYYFGYQVSGYSIDHFYSEITKSFKVITEYNITQQEIEETIALVKLYG